MAEGNLTKTERSKYRSSFGATLLFSGIQIYQILIRIVRSKFIALFIGPVGMGISSLLRSTTDVISATTNLGLKTSGVKTISTALAEGDRNQISKTIITLRRLILITGLLGTAVCALLAPLWSHISFGDNSYVWPFVFVSILILFDQLNNGEIALLQGLQEKKRLAKANILGQTIGLIITIPLYYFYGIRAIVWVLVLSSLFSMLISRLYTYSLKIPQIRIPWSETLLLGRGMIKLGFFLSLQYLLSQVSLYIIRNCISNWGTIDEVGLYSAGTSIVDGYIGLIFTAMATDYFPRLAATKSNHEMNITVKQQSELSMLLVAPIVVAFLLFMNPIILLLYSDRFLPIEGMMNAAIGATVIKALAWSLSYTLLAKGKPLHFFLNELASLSYSVPIKLFAYRFGGLTGFGYAILLCYVLYLIQLIIVSRRFFGTQVDKEQWRICLISCLLVFATMATKLVVQNTYYYIIGIVLLLFSSIYSFNELNKRVGIISLLREKISLK